MSPRTFEPPEPRAVHGAAPSRRCFLQQVGRHRLDRRPRAFRRFTDLSVAVKDLLWKSGLPSCRQWFDEPIEVFMVPVMVADMDAGRCPRQGRPIDVLVGRRLEYVQLGHAIVLGFSGGRQVVIEAVAHLDGPGGRVDVEPGEDPSDVLATLLGDVVRAARTRDTGELQITFGTGSELLVGVDDEYESWAVAGPGGFLIVCLARGELAVWGDATSSRRLT